MGGKRPTRRSFVKLTAGTTAVALGGAAVVQPAAATDGEIDIKPGSDPNSFNPCGGGVIPVELISAGQYKGEALPGTDALVDTLRFGPPRLFGDGNAVNNPEIEESIQNGDGAGPVHGGHDEGGSLVVHFSTQEAGFEPGDEVGMLIGEFEWPGFEDTRLIKATDSVNLVGCGGGPSNGRGNGSGQDAPGKGPDKPGKGPDKPGKGPDKPGKGPGKSGRGRP